MKSTILLALTLFLISAPAPDSNDIAEMTANFIVPLDTSGLLAADEVASENNSSVHENADLTENKKNNEQYLVANANLENHSIKD